MTRPTTLVLITRPKNLYDNAVPAAGLAVGSCCAAAYGRECAAPAEAVLTGAAH
jgi:hypothetical protein